MRSLLLRFTGAVALGAIALLGAAGSTAQVSDSTREPARGPIQPAAAAPHDAPATVPAPEAEIANGRGKIVGGENAPVGRYPWMVALGYRVGEGPIQVKCGGSLIRGDWVVSAAHCKLREGYFAIAGRIDLTKPQGQEIEIAEVFRHPHYNPVTKKESDIVLARLKFSPGITPIPVISSTEDTPRSPEPLWVAGWGKLSEDNPLKPDILQHVEVKVSDQQICTQNYGAIQKVVSNTMLCAAEKEADACTGDSGGPLVQFHPLNGSAKLTGIVSWGEGCARPSYPGVYVNLTQFRKWIDECIADASRQACRRRS